MASETPRWDHDSFGIVLMEPMIFSMRSTRPNVDPVEAVNEIANEIISELLLRSEFADISFSAAKYSLYVKPQYSGMAGMWGPCYEVIQAAQGAWAASGALERFIVFGDLAVKTIQLWRTKLAARRLNSPKDPKLAQSAANIAGLAARHAKRAYNTPIDSHVSYTLKGATMIQLGAISAAHEITVTISPPSGAELVYVCNGVGEVRRHIDNFGEEVPPYQLPDLLAT